MWNYTWNFLKSVGTVSFFIIAVLAWVFPFNAEKRALNYSIEQNVQLLATFEKLEQGSLQFTYQGQNVPNLVAVKIRFKNSGNQPLKKDEFGQGLKIIFPTDTKIIKYALVQAQPFKSQEISQNQIQKVGEQGLLFLPEFINPGEIFDLDIITTRYNLVNRTAIYDSNQIKLDYRIYGVSKINFYSSLPTNTERKVRAQEKVHNATELISHPLSRIAILGVLLLLIPRLLLLDFLQKNDSAGKLLSHPMTKSVVSILTFLLVYGSFVVVFGYQIFSIVYDAWFLPI